MKDSEASLMMRAGVIDRAVITREWTEKPGGWEIWLYGDKLPSDMQNPIELARGGRRTWASLDTAYSWLRAAADKGIEMAIEERFYTTA